MLGKNWRKGVGLCTLTSYMSLVSLIFKRFEGSDRNKIYLNIDATLPRLRDVRHCCKPFTSLELLVVTGRC
jgi:hypothetical protein